METQREKERIRMTYLLGVERDMTFEITGMLSEGLEAVKTQNINKPI